MTDIPIRCRCGNVQGKLRKASPRRGNHVICHCRDCQNFAHYLGRGDEILDEWGGTEVFQVSPGAIEIDSGIEHVTCVHLTEQPTLRWYTDCCKTAIGNTLATNKLPFIGLIHDCLDASEIEGGLGAVTGPVRARVNCTNATGDTSKIELNKSAPLSVYLNFFKILLRSKMTGDYKSSPLFDAATGRPIVSPTRSSPLPGPQAGPPE